MRESGEYLPKGVAMLSKRGVDYLAGGLLIALIVTFLVQIFVDPIGADTFKEDPAGILRAIAENQTQIVVSTAFAIAGNFILILFAAALYLTFRAHDRNLALIGSFGFLAAGVLFLTIDLVVISLYTLSESFTQASGAQAESILNSASAVGLMADPAAAMSLLGLAIGFLSYGLLVVTTGAVPRWIGWFGIVGGLVAPFGWLYLIEADLFGVGFIGVIVGLLFALITGLWLVLKGSREVAQATS